MRKTRILFTISNIAIGGPQKSLLALLDRIDYEKFEVDICVLRPGGILKGYYNENVNFVDVPEIITAATLPKADILCSLGVFLKNGRISMFFDGIGCLLKHVIFKKNMNRERQRFWFKHKDELPKLYKRYDLAFGINGHSTYYMTDCVDADKKYHWVRCDTRILNRDEKIDGEYYRKLDGSLSVSSQCGEIFEDIYPFMKGKVKVFYNHIPVSFYERMDYDKKLLECEEDYKKILTITRLDPLKGIEMAIDACEILIKRGEKVRWFVLGGGSHRAEIEKMIRERGLEESFILLGFQLNTYAFIKDSDFVVHPSRTEGKSNAVDEAKHCGKPVIATNYPTVGEQISHGETGLICDMSGDAIASTLTNLIKDMDLISKIEKNCRGKEDGMEDLTEFFMDLCR